MRPENGVSSWNTRTSLLRSKTGVGLITLNRPKALNALNAELLRELIGVLEEWDRGRKCAASC